MLRWPELPFGSGTRPGPPGPQQPWWCECHAHIIRVSLPEGSVLALEMRELLR